MTKVEETYTGKQSSTASVQLQEVSLLPSLKKHQESLCGQFAGTVFDVSLDSNTERVPDLNKEFQCLNQGTTKLEI